jgi:hypothetical protein
MTLQYIEQNVAHLADAARCRSPSWCLSRRIDAAHRQSASTVDDYARELDALVLMGGSRRVSRTYGENGAAARVERRPHPRRL